jgi:hypothetical protein
MTGKGGSMREQAFALFFRQKKNRHPSYTIHRIEIHVTTQGSAEQSPGGTY